MNTYRMAVRTGPGRVRDDNQDHVLVGRIVKNSGSMGMHLDQYDDYLVEHGLLLAVSDGVGGVAGGRTASKLALAVLEQEFHSMGKPGSDLVECTNALRAAASRANEAVLQVAADDPSLAGMAATLCGICLLRLGYLVFNAGDSRVYRWRNGILKQLTLDDSVTAMAVRQGAMSPAEAGNSPARHTLTNWIGSTAFTIDVQPGPALRDGDYLLACSDGIHDLLDHDEIERVFAAGGIVESLVDDLFDAAMAKGGHDNIALVMLHASPVGEPWSTRGESPGAGEPPGRVNDSGDYTAGPRGEEDGQADDASRLDNDSGERET